MRYETHSTVEHILQGVRSPLQATRVVRIDST